MRSKLTLLTTAAAFAFGLAATAALAEDAPGAKSDITIVGTDNGDAPSGAEQGTPGAADEGSAAGPDAGDAGDGGAVVQGQPSAGDEGDTSAQGGAEDQGAAGKSTEDLGAPPAAKPGKQGQLPSPSSAY